MMKDHLADRKGHRSSDPQRFLRGLVFLPDGRPLRPTHATKGTRRYPYYFAEADVSRTDQAVRLPAAELERTVVEGLRKFLDDPLRLSEHFGSLPVCEMQRLLASAKEKEMLIADLTNSSARLQVRSMLRRIIVQDGNLSIEIECAVLVEEPSELASESIAQEAIRLSVPFQIQRRGREVRLVITGSSSPPQPVDSLVRAVAMAREWAECIEAGEIFALNQLATECGIERSYAQKVFRLVALSPELIEVILSGQHKAGHTFASVTKQIPLQWNLQALGSGA